MGVQIKEPIASRRMTIRSLRQAITLSGSSSRCRKWAGRSSWCSLPRCW